MWFHEIEQEQSTIEQIAQAALVSTVPEVPFYIPATDLPARPRYTLKHDDSFLILDSHGDIGAASGGSDGFFTMTRASSRISSFVSTIRPRSCSAAMFVMTIPPRARISLIPIFMPTAASC